MSHSAYMRVTGLGKRFGHFAALTDMSFDVGRGETLALLGPSGCGKTTVLRSIAGLAPPTAGSIEIDGKTVFDAAKRINLPPEQRALGVVFQSYAIWPHMTVAENVGFPLRVRGIKGSEATRQVREILDLVKLSDWHARSATALSGGQQQRVALARALVHKPNLVLFDEPMSNLDAQLRDEMRMELKMLQERLCFTSIYVTHDQSEALALAQRIIVMNRGQIEAIGTPREIFGKPGSAFVARFLGYNLLAGRVVVADITGVTVAINTEIQISGRPVGKAVAVGDPAVVGVRREHVRLAPQGKAIRCSGAQILPGRIRAASYQGLANEFDVQLGEFSLRALQPECGLETGAVDIVLDAADCLVMAP